MKTANIVTTFLSHQILPYNRYEFLDCSTNIIPSYHQGTILHSTYNKDIDVNSNIKYPLPSSSTATWGGIPASNTKEKDESSKEKSLPYYLMHHGKAAQFMQLWPTIVTFTLVKGWKPGMLKDFTRAVEEVIHANPILTGFVYSTPNWKASGRMEIRIQPGKYLPENHDFVTNIDMSNDTTKFPSPIGLNVTKLLAYVDDHLTPLIKRSEFVSELIKYRSPLFSIDIVTLPDNYACYVLKMAHCVGDGHTYYNIMNQISSILNNQPIKEINWTHPEIPTHEIYPSTFSQCDIQKSYGLPFMLGASINLFQLYKQKKGYFVLSKKKIQEKQIDLASNTKNHLTANDIITSALCESNLSSEIFAFTRDMRTRRDLRNVGGNFHCEVPFWKHVAIDPNLFHPIVRKGRYFEKDELPLLPFLFGRTGKISSLATIEKLIEKKNGGDSMKVVCHCLPKNFAGNVPLDVAFVTSMDDECFVVLHNFREVKVGPLLRDILM